MLVLNIRLTKALRLNIWSRCGASSSVQKRSHTRKQLPAEIHQTYSACKRPAQEVETTSCCQALKAGTSRLVSLGLGPTANKQWSFIRSIWKLGPQGTIGTVQAYIPAQSPGASFLLKLNTLVPHCLRGGGCLGVSSEKANYEGHKQTHLFLTQKMTVQRGSLNNDSHRW